MTSNDKIVKIFFESEDRVSKVMAALDTNISNFTSGIENATQPLADIAEKAVLAEAALVSMVAGGILYAVSEAGSFSDGFNEISTLVDATSQDISSFKQDIIDYGRESKKSYEDINGAVYSAISAGVDYKEALGSLAQAEKLSIAAKADLNSTMVVLASTLNAYGESTSEAGRYSDVFFKTVQLGQTTLPELSASLAQVTGLAAAGGIPIETLAAAIAAVTVSGMPTSQTMTALKAAISNIISPSAEAAKTADELGIGFSATALKTKGFEGVLKDVWMATGGNIDQMAKLFGSTEALNAVLILAEDKSGKFKNALYEMANAAGSTAAAHEKMAENMKLVNQNLINNIQATLIQFGIRFLDEYGGIAEGISALFQGISIGMDQGAFDPVFDFLEEIGRDLGAYLKGIAKAMPEALKDVDFTGLLSSVRGLGAEIKGLFDAFFGKIDLTTPEGLAKAMQKIIDSGETLTRTVAGIVGGLKPFVKGLGEAVDGVNGFDESTKNTVGQVLGFATGLNKLTGALNVLAPALSAFAISGAVKNTLSILGAMGVTLGTLGAIAVPAVIVGTAAGIGLLSDKLANYISELGRLNQQPKDINMQLVFDDGNILGLIDGIVRDAEGNIISIPIKFETDEEAVKRQAKEATAKVKAALLDGTSDAVINYMIEPNTEKLTAALKETGAYVKVDVEFENKLNEKDLHWTDAKGTVHSISSAIDLPVTTRIVDAETTTKAVSNLSKSTEEKLKIIETAAETTQKAFEWEAKVDIAQVEASTRIVEAVFESIETEISSTGSTISSLFSNLNSASSSNTYYQIKNQLEKESDMREEAHNENMKMMEVQRKIMEARLDAMQAGKPMYTIEAANLAPHLEAIWVEIVKAIQVRATEDGFESLIGL